MILKWRMILFAFLPCRRILYFFDIDNIDIESAFQNVENYDKKKKELIFKWLSWGSSAISRLVLTQEIGLFEMNFTNNRFDMKQKNLGKLLLLFWLLWLWLLLFWLFH